MDRRVHDVADAPGLVAHQAGDQPVAEVGDGDQPKAALVDHQSGVAAEAGMAAGELEAGDEFELADPGRLSIARVQVDGAGGEAKGLGRRRGGQEQREDEDAPEGQGAASASWRRTFSASRAIERSWMPSCSR